MHPIWVRIQKAGYSFRSFIFTVFSSFFADELEKTGIGCLSRLIIRIN